jgi:L-alanine-DL-glutamate epimerase-like enolase superfamily enzyme
MKIKTVRCLHVHGILDEPIGICETPHAQPFADWRDDGTRNIRAAFVEITTDDGLTGLSRSIDLEMGRGICRLFRDALTGRDPTEIDDIWDRLIAIDSTEHPRWHGFVQHVDMAIWDILGKAAGKPVYKLLNENGRGKVPVYASMADCSTDSDSLRERALRLYNDGYTAQKWFFTHLDAPDSPWIKVYKDKFKTFEEGRADNIRIARELRETLGPDATILLSAYAAWTERYAMDMLEAIAPYKPLWIEGPVAGLDGDAAKRIRQHSRIPLVCGCSVGNLEDVRGVLENEVYDVFRPDEGSLGGITGMMRAADLCREYGIRTSPHAGDVATMHFVAAQEERHCPFLEYLILWQKVGQWFFKHRYLAEHGMLKLPEAPGLGIELDDARILKREYYDG